MKKVLNFDDFLFDSLFENKVEVSFTLTDRLYDLLRDINHPISRSITDLDSDDFLNDKLTLLDYDDDDRTKFTYTVPSKLVDLLSNIKNSDKEEIKKDLINRSSRAIFRLIDRHKEDGILVKNRTSASINKVVNKLFPNKFEASGKPGEDLESFKEMIVSKRKELDDAFNRFKIVDGDELLKYYHYSKISKKSEELETPLFKSCMKHDRCQDYLRFYSENSGVKMVVLFSEQEEGKIDGRALLWDIDYLNGDDVDLKFMDRIYYTYQSDIQLFKNYAKKHGWLNKKHQNMEHDEYIEDLKNDDKGRWELKTVSTFRRNDTYPYLDTLRYYYHDDGFLSNEEYDTNHYVLQETHGGYKKVGGVYVEYYGEFIDEDDLTWCELGQEYRLEDDAIYIVAEYSYATTWYVDNYFTWSNINDEYIRDEHSVYSDYMEDSIHVHDSVRVLHEDVASLDSYKSIGEENFDELDKRLLDDFIKYDTGDEDFGILYFHPKDEDYFVPAYSTKNKKEVNAHMVWDKHRMYKKDGIYYLFDGDQKEIDKIIGQYSLFDNKKNKI